MGVKNEYGEIWGYVRVSTKEQHEDRQLDALQKYGVDESHIFVDKQSGKNFNRPAYKHLIRIIRKGDIIVIKSIDRLGRNYQDIIDQWRMITQDIGCGIHVIDMPTLNTSGDPSDLLSKFITDMMLQVLSFVAQNERENTIARQKEGIAAAKRRRKVKIGRPKKKMPFDFWEIYIMWKNNEFGTNDLWRYCHEMWGTSNRTFYRRLHELDQRFGDVPPNRLRDIIMDEEMYDGIEFSTERLEAAIDIYNPYALHNPEKARKRREEKNSQKDKTEAALAEEERELQQLILAKRQKEFRERFGIDDDSDTTTKNQKQKQDNEGPTGFRHVANNHKKGSGIDDAIELKPKESKKKTKGDDDIIIDPSRPIKTVIIT